MSIYKVMFKSSLPWRSKTPGCFGTYIELCSVAVFHEKVMYDAVPGSQVALRVEEVVAPEEGVLGRNRGVDVVLG